MVLGIEALSLEWIILLFFVGTLLIGYSGVKSAKIAESIAFKSGMGQAITGALFLGISTSLSGTILTFYTAGTGHAELAISNSIGGIAAQTAFLALADMTLRRVNLEHAAASLENLAQGALLVILLAIPLLALHSPETVIWGIHPATVILVAFYLFGIGVVSRTRTEPMWSPKHTRRTQKEEKKRRIIPDSMARLIGKFLLQAAVLTAAGMIVAESGVALADKSGISETLVGALFTSVSTSLPELITAVAAVKQGALNLAVGDIIGGNSFDVLFLAGADLFYTEGSIYHRINDSHIMIIGMAMMMTGVLLLGMIRRQEHGVGNIGFESVMILGLYATMVVLLVV